jgi:hypothetical protein
MLLALAVTSKAAVEYTGDWSTPVDDTLHPGPVSIKMEPNAIDELNAIQHQLLAGWVAGNPSTHERLLDDGWGVIEPSGQIMCKTDVLSTAFAAEGDIEFAEIDQINVRDHVDFAIVTGRTRVRGKVAGQDLNITLRFTDVFTNRSGTWKCLASQGTFVSGPHNDPQAVG